MPAKIWSKQAYTKHFVDKDIEVTNTRIYKF